MNYKVIFWILIVITILIASFQLVKFSSEIVIVLLTLNLIILGMSLEKKEVKENDKLTSKLENIEKLCSIILRNISTELSLMNMKSEMKKQKESTEKTLNEINEKTRKLEENLNEFGRKLADSLKELESRIETLESRE